MHSYRNIARIGSKLRMRSSFLGSIALLACSVFSIGGKLFSYFTDRESSYTLMSIGMVCSLLTHVCLHMLKPWESISCGKILKWLTDHQFLSWSWGNTIIYLWLLFTGRWLSADSWAWQRAIWRKGLSRHSSSLHLRSLQCQGSDMAKKQQSDWRLHQPGCAIHWATSAWSL